MTDNEFDKACNFLLVGLRDQRPQLAKELTMIMNGPKYKGLTKTDRKIRKIRLLYERDPNIISAIFAAENAAWAQEPRSNMSSFFYMLERRTTFLNPYGERTGGNYSTKA